MDYATTLKIARARSVIRVEVIKSNGSTPAEELDPVILALIDSGYRVIEGDDPKASAALLARD